MNAHDVKLAADFEAASREQWLRLVDKAIKGADFEKKMVAKTEDNIRIEPIYVRADALAVAEMAVPGAAPFTRGAHAAVAGLGWEIRQGIGAADPSDANTQIITELDGGTNGIVLEIAAPGKLGCRIESAADMTTALRGMRLDLAPIELKAGLGSAAAARHFLASLAGLGIPAGTVQAFLGLDPIGTLVRFGTLPGAPDAAIGEAVAIAKDARAAEPLVRALKADGSVYHEAGATPGFELAVLASTFVAYLRAFEAAGIDPKDAVGQIAFVLAADTDQFATVAKIRAARRILFQIANAAGAGDAAAHLHLSAVTSQRVMAKRDPWVNMLRTTIACAGAALGGAEAITVLPFTVALGEPDAFARRAARNIQIVLQEESNLGRVLDPMGGSWYIEKLTDDLAKVAWGLFQEIEGKGGVVAGLTSGFVQDKVAADANLRAKAMATGRIELTGVSAFPLLGDDGVTVQPFAEPAKIATAQIVKALLPQRLAQPFEDLRDKADTYTAKTGKTLVVFLASIGQVIDHTIRSTWVQNYLAAAGIKALTTDGYETAAAAAAAFKASGAGAACICSSDALNAEHAEATARALKAAGAKLVLMAGRPGESEAALKTAGVDQFLFAGADAVATLSGLQSKLGIEG